MIAKKKGRTLQERRQQDVKQFFSIFAFVKLDGAKNVAARKIYHLLMDTSKLKF